jgi:hypothetical protein
MLLIGCQLHFRLLFLRQNYRALTSADRMHIFCMRKVKREKFVIMYRCDFCRSKEVVKAARMYRRTHLDLSQPAHVASL